MEREVMGDILSASTDNKKNSTMISGPLNVSTHSVYSK